MNRTKFACTIIGSLALLGSAALLTAGPLDPPAGPVSSTYKTLNEVEPRIVINATNTPGDNDATPSRYKITQAGSYILPGNQLLSVSRIGIEIATSDVVIDLGGFQLNNFSTLPAIAVTISGARNITVRNGSVVGAAGIDLSGSTLAVPVSGGVVENVHARDIGGVGLSLQQHAVARGCTANNCSTGISASTGCTLEQCTATGCTTFGILAADVCSLNGCAATANGGAGFSIGTGSAASRCTARSNAGSGFTAGTSATLEHCGAYSNAQNGYLVGSQCVLRGCTAGFNSVDGISVNIGSLVADCSSGGNDNDGIECTYGCTILNNVCRQNGSMSADGAGVHVLNNDNRIEGNNCSNADRGIDVDGTGNIIIRNTCATNTINWTIVAGNAYGPIVAAPAGAAVNGSTAVDASGSTHPNANFSY